jgi:hypothetical protein
MMSGGGVEELALLRNVAHAADRFVNSAYGAPFRQGQPEIIGVEEFEQLEDALDELKKLHKFAVVSRDAVFEVPEDEEPWLEGWARPKSRPCEHCGSVIFFAKLPTGRWLPLEIGPVDACGVLPSWRYVVTFTDPPSVTTSPTQTNGYVWVDHRQTCGMKEEGPRYKVKTYLKRWTINRARAEALADELGKSLAALRDRLATKVESAGTDAEE